MTWSAEHAGMSANRLSWLLVIEGLPYVFVSASGDSSMWDDDDKVADWFGGFLQARSVRHGLEFTSVSSAINEREWFPQEGQATFKIVDFDGRIASLFGAEPEEDDVDALAQIIEAGRDPLTDNVLALIGGSVDPAAKHIGIEYIGASGQRLYRTPLPIDLPGPRHAVNQDAPSSEAPIPISSDPLIMEGRRVTLWALWPDPDGDPNDLASWGTWLDHFESGRSLVWWGKLRDRPTVGADRVWSIPCNGPESWLDRQCNTDPWTEPIGIASSLTLADDERGVCVAFRVSNTNVEGDPYLTNLFKGAIFDVTNQLSVTGDRDERTAELDAIIQAVGSGVAASVNINAGDGDFFDYRGNSAGIDSAGRFSIRTQRFGNYDEKQAMTMMVCLHRKAWAMLGYDVLLQQNAESERQRLLFFSVDGNDPRSNFSNQGEEPPGSGYYWTDITTRVPYGATHVLDNNGQAVFYEPLTTMPLSVIHEGAVVSVTPDDPSLLLEGQPLIEPSSAEVDGVRVNRARFFLLRGRVATLEQPTLDRPAGEVEEDEITVPVLGEWVDAAGTVGKSDDLSGGVYPAIVITSFLEPREFGVEGKSIREILGNDPIWITNQASLVPLGTVGIFLPEIRASALRTMLVSDGTAQGWDGASWVNGDGIGIAYLGVGDNIERHQFGLGIPKEMLGTQQEFFAAFQGADVLDNRLALGRYSRRGPFPSLDVIKELTGHVGLGWSLHGSRYTCFDAYQAPSQADVAVEIVEERCEGRPTNTVPNSRLSAMRLAWRGDPEGGTTMETVFSANDRAARYRGKIEQRVQDSWPLPSQSLNGGWFGDAQRRLDARAQFWSRRNFVVELPPVPPDLGLQIFPGTVIRLTHQNVLDPRSGTYGVTAKIGRVLSRSLDKFGYATIRALMYLDTGVATQPHYAPIALTVARSYDSTGRWVQCLPDFRKSGDSNVCDVRGFVRPSWASSLTPGDALVQIREQSRNGDWSIVDTGTITDVDEAGNRLRFGTPFPTFKRDKTYYITLAPYDDPSQVQWVKDLYGIVTNPGGTTTGARKFLVP